MKTALAIDDIFVEHETEPGHPESPERVLSIARRLEESGITSECSLINWNIAVDAWIALHHDFSYIQRLRSAVAKGFPYIDTPESSISPKSELVARQAVGAVISAVDSVIDQRSKNAFCIVRPPGHHAEYDRSMGFCLYNNVAIAARYLLKQHNLSRVLVIDFDVHHGNGTQHSFEEDSTIFFCSVHGHPDTLYPGTGYAHEQGIDAGHGYTLNLPMEQRSDEDRYRRVLERDFLPKAAAFNPEFVLISAGFDAHKDDPIGNQNLKSTSFYVITKLLVDLAKDCCDGKIVSVLEGGYNLKALADSAEQHMTALLEV